MAKVLTKADVEKLKTATGALMDHVYHLQHPFGLKPKKDHTGVCINYVDLKEFRDEFLEELVNTIVAWVYSQAKVKKLMKEYQADPDRDLMNAINKITADCFSKFRERDGRDVFIQGQFGELLLFNLMQHFFNAVPLLRKLPIKTSPKMEVNGADAIHYAFDGTKHLFYLGESKCYYSASSFAKAVDSAIESMVTTYNAHTKELKMYLYDDFLDNKLIQIAKDYKKGKLPNPEVELVCIIAYQESKRPKLTSEAEIKKQIMDMIEDRCAKLDPAVFDKIPKHLRPRFHFILFPMWEMKQLLEDFQKLIGK